LERVTPSPAVFDMEKLYWLNRHYIKQSAPERIEALALPFYQKIFEGDPAAALVKWLGSVTRLLSPYVDRLEQLPEKAKFIFSYDAKAALAAEDNAEVLGWSNTKAVISRFAVKVLADESAKTAEMTAECFKQLVNEVKVETGAKGKELFHP